MILAAGRGERMRPLTDTCPKPLLHVQGLPLITHHILKFRDAGIDEFVINYAWLGHRLVEELGDGSALSVNIHWSAESCALETAGGIVHALPLLGEEPFLVISGDIWLDADYRQFLRMPLCENGVHLWLVNNPSYHPQGDFALQDDFVYDRPQLTYANIGVYSPVLFQDLIPGKRPLLKLLRTWITQGIVTGTYLSSAWWNLGTPEQLAALEQMLQSE